MPQKGVIDDNLQEVLRAFASSKVQAAEQRKLNGAVPWLRPPLTTWTGGIQTAEALIDIHKAFNTDMAENALIATFDPADPGTNGDSILLSLQIDYLSQAERAYRARISQGFIRTLAHVATRETAHGQPNGILLGQTLNYFFDLFKQGA